MLFLNFITRKLKSVIFFWDCPRGRPEMSTFMRSRLITFWPPAPSAYETSHSELWRWIYIFATPHFTRRYLMSISPNPEFFGNSGNSGNASISSTMPAKMPTIPAFSGDTNSAGIVEALPELPGLSKISWFWICMYLISEKCRQSWMAP